MRHYSHAMCGVACAFLPDAPETRSFFYPSIIQSVLEYRAYLIVIPFCALLARVAPPLAAWFLSGVWLAVSIRRAWSFRSPVEFWARLWSEAHHPRTRTAYTEFLIRDIEERSKRGEDTRAQESIAWRLIDETVLAGRKEARHV